MCRLRMFVAQLFAAVNKHIIVIPLGIRTLSKSIDHSVTYCDTIDSCCINIPLFRIVSNQLSMPMSISVAGEHTTMDSFCSLSTPKIATVSSGLWKCGLHNRKIKTCSFYDILCDTDPILFNKIENRFRILIVF